MMPKRVISKDVTPPSKLRQLGEFERLAKSNDLLAQSQPTHVGACIVRKIKRKNNIILEIKAIAICQTSSGDCFFV